MQLWAVTGLTVGAVAALLWLARARAAHPLDPGALAPLGGGSAVGRRDPTYLALLLCTLLVIFCAGGEAWLSPSGRVDAMAWAGRALLVLGAALTLWGRSALGTNYAPTAYHTDPAQELVRSGPYRWLRHPMYLGNLLSLVGLPLALSLRWTLLALVPTAIAFVWRVRVEERFLRARFAPAMPPSPNAAEPGGYL